MIKIRWGIGGAFVLWVIGMALWAAVGLARSARGDSAPSPVLGGQFVRAGSVAPVACPRVDEIVTDAAR